LSVDGSSPLRWLSPILPSPSLVTVGALAALVLVGGWFADGVLFAGALAAPRFSEPVSPDTFSAARRPAPSRRRAAEEEEACTPDAMRLCSRFIPNERLIEACLNENIQQLSPDCRTVMTSGPAKKSKKRKAKKRKKR
jgi:hypothetical protein